MRNVGDLLKINSRPSIKAHRSIINMSGKRLKRARRLYAQIIWPTCRKSPEMTIIFAQRAIMNGLYAISSVLDDVVFYMYRAFYKIERKLQHYDRLYGWYHFGDAMHYRDLINNYKKRKTKFGKKVIRVVG